jgi:formylglycine-generating enzyme required for sulfatase activity
MKKTSWLCHILLPVFLLPGCGKAIKTAQDYTVNRPPVIVSMTVVNSDKSGKVVPFSSYPVTVTATDPDAGQTLTYSFSSSGTGGSFAGQTSVTGGYSATFVAGDLAANQTVYVYVKVSDGHGGYATSSVNVGTAKNGPAISVSTDKTAIKPTDALTLNAFANCDGVFQIWPDSSTNPVTAPSAIDTSAAGAASKPMRIYSRGSASAPPVTSLSLAGPGSSAVSDAVLSPVKSSYPDETTYNLWVVFRDGLGSVTAMSLPVIVDNVQPVITGWTPSSGTGSIPLSTSLKIAFSENVNPSTLAGALSLSSSAGSVSVGTPSYDSSTHTASFPVSGLSAAFYTAQLSSQVTDIAGNALDAAKNSSVNFMTEGYVAPNGNKAITSFSLYGTQGIIDENNKTINITITASDHDVTKAVPSFTTTGMNVTVNGAMQTSGSSVHDFTNPVTYTVTASDGTTAAYTVSVHFTVVVTSGTGVYGTTTYTLPGGNGFTVVQCTPSTISGSGIVFPTGLYDSTNATISTPFSIEQTEVTYELWIEVYDWAVNHGYTFANSGQNGVNGLNADNTTYKPYDTLNNYPVANINWRDAMIWCNALTEYYNANNGSGTDLAVVYCSDNTYTTPIRTCDNTSTYTFIQDNPCLPSNPSGFRLPSRDEYEFAARYMSTNESYAVSHNDSSGSHTALTDGYSWTPGSYPSGATTNTDASFLEIAWCASNSIGKTQSVGTKKPNALSLYDMSGNIYEWLFGGSPDNRSCRGGSIFDYAQSNYLRIGNFETSAEIPPNFHTGHPLGFRFARNL